MSRLGDESVWCLRQLKAARAAMLQSESALRMVTERAADLEAAAPDAATAELRNRCVLPIGTSGALLLRHLTQQYGTTESALTHLSRCLPLITGSVAAAETCASAAEVASLEVHRADSCVDASAKLEHGARQLTARSLSITETLMKRS